MIKSAAICCAALFLSAPVLAGPYIEAENNAGWDEEGKGTGHTTDLHIGYEDSVGALDWFVQAGPMLDNPSGPGEESDVDFSGKLGASVAATDKLSIYGELSGVFQDQSTYGSKLGAKYAF